MSSDEIRSIATAAIENQIRLAELAENGTSSATIREYAALVIQEQRALAEGWRTIPVDNPRVRHQFAIQLDQRSERAASEMGQVGNSIGPSYLDHERDQHHWFIALLDNSLIPSADDPYLLAQLRRARAIAEEEQAALARL